jgi:DNA-binding response OmpR family regulator
MNVSAADLQIRVLAVTQNAAGWNALDKVAGANGWTLFWAHSCEAALNVLSQNQIPVVIYDRDLPGEGWKSALSRIGLYRKTACIFLASTVTDEYLWREVVQNRGFDVLTKPFQEERLVRMVNVACSWHGWTDNRATGGAASD